MSVSSAPPPVKPPPLVVLTTDFGCADAYVGTMKAVVLGICPTARLLDLTHGIPPQDVLWGCLTLEAARPFIPHGCFHLAVVDPEVGTGRPALAVRTEREVYVAPDNGLLSFLPAEQILEARRIENSDLFLHPVSRTFHGRDVFAPAAALLASGADFSLLGPEAGPIRRLRIPEARLAPEGLLGEVLAFDGFGNALTSIRAGCLEGGAAAVRCGGREVPFACTYADVPPGEAVCLVGSGGRLEIAVRNGSARDRLGLDKGSGVLLLEGPWRPGYKRSGPPEDPLPPKRESNPEEDRCP